MHCDDMQCHHCHAQIIVRTRSPGAPELSIFFQLYNSNECENIYKTIVNEIKTACWTMQNPSKDIYLLFEHPLYEYTMLQSVTPAYTCSIALLLTALRVVFDLEPLNETVFDVKFI